MSQSYENELAGLSVVSLFSFFEEHTKAILREIVDFHGGESAFKALSKNRASRFIGVSDPTIVFNKRKLQEYPITGKTQKYKKHANVLAQSGFRFPTELLAHYGAGLLLDKADEKRGMRAWEIPVVLKDALLFPMTPKQEGRLNQIRKMRNKIAHGGTAGLNIRYAAATSTDLHSLAAGVDKHVIDNFMILERFL